MIQRWKEDEKREDIIFMIALQWPKGSIFVGEWTKKPFPTSLVEIKIADEEK